MAAINITTSNADYSPLPEYQPDESRVINIPTSKAENLNEYQTKGKFTFLKNALVLVATFLFAGFMLQHCGQKRSTAISNVEKRGFANFFKPKPKFQPPKLPPRKIIAIGDLHGDYQQTLKVFRMAGVIDSQLQWAAGESVFVQTGDIVDRGDDALHIYELMMRLTEEASQAGGKVIQLLGNHELMNMEEDLRYVTEGDYEMFGGEEARKYQFSKEGDIGKYLRTLGVTAFVDGNVFVHGGIESRFASVGISRLNQETRKSIEGKNANEIVQSPIFGASGPLWSRILIEGTASRICYNLEDSLRKLSAKRMFVGHTPQLTGKILKRCDGLIYDIDVGISEEYGGNLGAVEILGDTVTAIYPNQRIEISNKKRFLQ